LNVIVGGIGAWVLLRSRWVGVVKVEAKLRIKVNKGEEK
jgi:hypothetical protein